MLDLKSCAIGILYPDGVFEKIPVKEYEYHLDYVQAHLKESERFATLCSGIDIGSFANHISLDKLLVPKGIVTLYNFNVYQIIQDSTYLENNIPTFQVFIPFQFESIEQIDCLERILEYPEENLQIYLQVPYTSNFMKSDLNTVKSFISDSKENLNSSKTL